jgi:hypothetical protein
MPWLMSAAILGGNDKKLTIVRPLSIPSNIAIELVLEQCLTVAIFNGKLCAFALSLRIIDLRENGLKLCPAARNRIIKRRLGCAERPSEK